MDGDGEHQYTGDLLGARRGCVFVCSRASGSLGLPLSVEAGSRIAGMRLAPQATSAGDMMYGQITGCRICGSEWLEVLLELGTQFLTGVFPRSPDESLTKGPLTLVRCDECGLVQLLYSYERTELYGAHYAYRSSLNRTMVNHLEAKAQMLMRTVDLRPDDVIVY